MKGQHTNDRRSVVGEALHQLHESYRVGFPRDGIGDPVQRMKLLLGRPHAGVLRIYGGVGWLAFVHGRELRGVVDRGPMVFLVGRQSQGRVMLYARCYIHRISLNHLDSLLPDPVDGLGPGTRGGMGEWDGNGDGGNGGWLSDEHAIRQILG